MRSSVRGHPYHIGELAARCGLTRDTLRYYERIGLLPKPQRTSGNFRVYSADTVEWLRFIKQAQAVGFTLREVRDLLGPPDTGGPTRCRRVRDMLRGKLTELQARLAELEGFRRTLTGYLGACERTLEDAGRRRSEPQCPVFDPARTPPRSG
jgi:DNA-binding transcriptional MerR regulator